MAEKVLLKGQLQSGAENVNYSYRAQRYCFV
jgi:hypothetical protein